MTDDLGLLFDAILPKRPSRFERIIIAAKWVTFEGQENALLILPHMRHFVDEQPLQTQVPRAEIFAEQIVLWMKP